MNGCFDLMLFFIIDVLCLNLIKSNAYFYKINKVLAKDKLKAFYNLETKQEKRMKYSILICILISILNRSSHRRYSAKRVLLEISQNLQENTCARVSFLIRDLRPATLLKKSLWHRCISVNFVKFLRTLFLQNTSGGCFCRKICHILMWVFTIPEKIIFTNEAATRSLL